MEGVQVTQEYIKISATHFAAYSNIYHVVCILYLYICMH